MSKAVQWGVMHPNGTMLPDSLGYPFASRRMASALAADLDEECEECGRTGHEVMRREVSDWCTVSARQLPVRS